jgi:hypothetical protein
LTLLPEGIVGKTKQAGNGDVKCCLPIVNKQGILATVECYDVRFEAFASMLFEGSQCFYQSLDIVEIDNKKYLFLCVIVAGIVAMPVFASPPEDFFLGKFDCLSILVLDSNPCTIISVSLHIMILYKAFI